MNEYEIQEELFQIRLNEVYHERNILVSLLSTIYPSHLAIDESSEEDFKYVVYIQTTFGQLSWHIRDEELYLFKHLAVRENNWDGHSTEEKYKRVENLKQLNVKINKFKN